MLDSQVSQRCDPEEILLREGEVKLRVGVGRALGDMTWITEIAEFSFSDEAKWRKLTRARRPHWVETQ